MTTLDAQVVAIEVVPRATELARVLDLDGWVDEAAALVFSHREPDSVRHSVLSQA